MKQRAKITNAEIAKRVGIHSSLIGKIFNGQRKITITTAQKIAKVVPGRKWTEFLVMTPAQIKRVIIKSFICE